MGLNNPEPPSLPESTSGAVYAAPQTYAAPPVPLAPGIPSGPPPASTQYPPVPVPPSTVPSVPPAFPPPFAPGVPLGFVSFFPLFSRSPSHRLQIVLLFQVFRCLHLWVYRLACCHRSILQGFLEDHHFRLLDSFRHQRCYLRQALVFYLRLSQSHRRLHLHLDLFRLDFRVLRHLLRRQTKPNKLHLIFLKSKYDDLCWLCLIRPVHKQIQISKSQRISSSRTRTSLQ